jgi:hypothetical protein
MTRPRRRGYTLTELAHRMCKLGKKIDVTTLRHYCQRGKLPASKIGRTWYVSADQAKRFADWWIPGKRQDTRTSEYDPDLTTQRPVTTIASL